MIPLAFYITAISEPWCREVNSCRAQQGYNLDLAWSLRPQESWYLWGHVQRRELHRGGDKEVSKGIFLTLGIMMKLYIYRMKHEEE